MTPLSFEAAWEDFQAAGLPPTLKGKEHAQALCPVCPKTLDFGRVPSGEIEIWCPGGCEQSRIADQLHFRRARGEWTPAAAADGAAPPTDTTHGSDRYEGRFLSSDALSLRLAEPAQPIPWRVHEIVADGTVTIVSGESGSGKSWLAQAFCSGVAHGRAVAGLPCRKGRALYFDGEMGPTMFVDQRLRPAGITVPEFDYIDAMGLDVSKPDDLGWLQGRIVGLGVKLVVIDSLRRLVPSKAENDSDDMAPTVAALAKLARDTGAAIVVIHHKGDGEKFYRGSTAIKDQADALFALLRDADDEHAPRRLRCRGGKGKMRYAPEPPDVHVEISPEDGGVVLADPPEDPGPVVPKREAVMLAIKAALPARTKKEIAAKVGCNPDNQMFRGAWSDLRAAGELVEINGVWEGGGGGLPLGNPTTTPLSSNGNGKLTEADLERLAAEHGDVA